MASCMQCLDEENIIIINTFVLYERLLGLSMAVGKGGLIGSSDPRSFGPFSIRFRK